MLELAPSAASDAIVGTSSPAKDATGNSNHQPPTTVVANIHDASTSTQVALHENSSTISCPRQPPDMPPLEAPLVDSCRHLLKDNGSILGREVAKTVLGNFPDLLSAWPKPNANSSVPSNRAALSCIDGRKPVTHGELKQFIVETGSKLHDMGIGRGFRVALVLPNGPELAAAILAVSNWACCVPLSAYSAVQELCHDLEAAAIDLVLGLDPDCKAAKHDPTRHVIPSTAAKLQIPFCGIQPDDAKAGVFTLVPPSNQVLPLVCKRRQFSKTNTGNIFSPNGHSDEVLVLFTSGTTGSKKLVPHIMADLLVGAACIAVSWELAADDTNCNLMPLFHVGGIIRQVYSPVLSAGCVICCPSFDPVIFWQLLSKGAFTWYYAAPTMHHLILQTGKDEHYLPQKSTSKTNQQQRFQLRMIANAAGGLLPSLARELRQAFSCNVLPSYGMTECMPITSPPASYQLEKPGTSGVAVGPEVAILNLKTLQPENAGKSGPICVRGEPCFRGYGVLNNGEAATSQPVANSFLPGGWFNTGDLGYMDSDGYLYITGRSKEVINRGGEIISPMEVEEAVNGHPDVLSCVAFSTKHSILQEVVGLVIILETGKPRRLDLPALHSYLQGRLAAQKWPQLLVYMDGIPKSHTNKLLRVKLGERLCLPELHDNMDPIERTFSADCPPQGTAVSVAIPCKRVDVNASQVQATLRHRLITNAETQDLIAIPHSSKIGQLVVHCYNLDRLLVVKTAQELLDAYAVPSHVCLLNQMVPTSIQTAPSHFHTISRQKSVDNYDSFVFTPHQPSDAIGSILQEAVNVGAGPTDPLVMGLQELFADLLDLDCLPAPQTNFFNLGGSSMLASQLASKIRQLHNVSFGGAEVFHHDNCNAIAGLIRERRGDGGSISSENGRMDISDADRASMAASSLFSKHLDLRNTPFDSNRLDSSSSTAATCFQLLPLFFIYPVWQLTRVFLFFRCLVATLNTVPTSYNILGFVLTLVIFHFLWVTITPLVFVIIKWTVIGTYKRGRYPLWSNYYLRWWFVDVLRKMIGRGIWGSNTVSLNFYYRLLGAKIGNHARISLEADLAEYDLVSIGEGAAVEYCTVRGFGVDNGAMILGPVSIGAVASVGARSVVAPYTSIPDGAHLGPATSSYELNVLNNMSSTQSTSDDPSSTSGNSKSGGNPKHARYNRQAIPEPSLLSQFFMVGPISTFVDSVSHLPALVVLYFMVSMPWRHDDRFSSVGDLLEWLCDFRRIPFYIGIRVAREVLAPPVYMATALLVKRCVIGKFKPGSRDRLSEWQLSRHFLAATLFCRQNMQDICEILGRHYQLVSGLYRLLGAKVGQRVFWPGHQPIFSGEFDLLEIGDDVVFGSRAAIFCTTSDGAEKVTLCAGSNVSDNTVVLPGSIIGKNAVLGSNSVCPADRYLPEASVWFGARGGEPVLLEKGVGDTTKPIMSTEVGLDKLEMDGDKTTLRPFGRAYYQGEAPYHVLSVWFMVIFTVMSKILIATVHTIPLLGAVHLAAGHFWGWSVAHRQYDDIDVGFFPLYAVMLFFFCFTHAIRVILCISVDLLAVRGFVGKRSQGRYNWDTCTYNQNWELYQILSRIRSFGGVNFLDFLSGTPSMAQFFRWHGCKIGKDCCLYPTGGDPYMSEPDLVTIGDRCIVDCSSVVCHLNTRGNFELVPIQIDSNVTLRTRSRIQQGVHIETGSMLLEKSLAMTGEIIEADTIWQGAPAGQILSYENSSIATNSSIENGGPRPDDASDGKGDESAATADNIFV